jgi:Ca2+-binding EF-hand superfamily protein
MFTKQQVLDILKEIDEDKTDTIDFFECLQVCFVFTIELCRVALAFTFTI